MRILTGKYKDTPIPFRPQPGLRPTPDRVRKAVIDALSPGWEGARVLDLFSGTGALGLEALSAGAAQVVFVEADGRRAAQIQQAVRAVGAESVCRVDHDDVWTALARIERLAESGERFDRVLADPPYEKGLAQKTLDFFKTGAGLKPGAWLVVETYKKEILSKTAGRLEGRRVALYGDTAVHYYVLV